MAKIPIALFIIPSSSITLDNDIWVVNRHTTWSNGPAFVYLQGWMSSCNDNYRCKPKLCKRQSTSNQYGIRVGRICEKQSSRIKLKYTALQPVLIDINWKTKWNAESSHCIKITTRVRPLVCHWQKHGRHQSLGQPHQFYRIERELLPEKRFIISLHITQ